MADSPFAFLSHEQFRRLSPAEKLSYLRRASAALQALRFEALHGPSGAASVMFLSHEQFRSLPQGEKLSYIRRAAEALQAMHVEVLGESGAAPGAPKRSGKGSGP